MKLESYKGYDIHLPTSGGKAGKGKAVTSSIQVRMGGMIKKQFRFKVDEPGGAKEAMRRARTWIDEEKS